jgi:hypothetical protein
MYIREFRIPLPLTVAEFGVGQLYAYWKCASLVATAEVPP